MVDGIKFGFLGRLLVPRRVFLYPLVLLVVMLCAYLQPIVTGHPPYDAHGEPIGGDLTAKLTGARIALSANMRHLYDARVQWAVQQALVGGVDRHGLSPFVAPPFAAYLFLPFAILPYMAGVVLWAIVSLSLLAISVRLLWPLLPELHRHGFGRVLLLVLSTLAAFRLLVTGQDAAISLFLLALGLRLLLARRDAAAGVVLALGLFKPQFFVLAPVLFLLQRRWHALAAWFVTAAGLTAISVALVGPEGVRAYLHLLRGGEFDKGGVYLGLSWQMPSLTALARLANAYLPSPLGTVVGVVTVGICLGLLAWWGLRCLKPAPDDRALQLLYSGMVLVTVVTSLHVQDYDLVMLLLPALLIYQAAPRDAAVHRLLFAAYVLSWGIAFLQPAFEHLPGPLPLLGAPWEVVPIIGLFVFGQRLLAAGPLLRPDPEELDGWCFEGLVSSDTDAGTAGGATPSAVRD